MTKYVTILPMHGYTRGNVPVPVPIPAGSPVEFNDDNLCYYVKPTMFPFNSIERHDATYYGFVVPRANVLPVDA